MCDSSSCPQGPTAAAVMVTSMAVLTTSVTCRTAQGCLGTICLNATHVHTYLYTCLPRETQMATCTESLEMAYKHIRGKQQKKTREHISMNKHTHTVSCPHVVQPSGNRGEISNTFVNTHV